MYNINKFIFSDKMKDKTRLNKAFFKKPEKKLFTVVEIHYN